MAELVKRGGPYLLSGAALAGVTLASSPARDTAIAQPALFAVAAAAVVYAGGAVVRRLGPLSDRSRYRRAYAAAVAEQHRFLDMRGLPVEVPLPLDLEGVYVDLRVQPNAEPSNTLMLATDAAAQPSSAAGHSVWHFLRNIEDRPGPALAILGAPGSGKSTLLRYLALCYATGRAADHGARRRVPIFLTLSEHVKVIAAGSGVQPRLSSLVEEHLRTLAGYPQPIAGWLEHELKARRGCVVLLDGLDEVDPDLRARISQWVDAQATEYRGNPFVLTSRPFGYRRAPLSRALLLEVRPFKPAQVRAFVHAFFAAHAHAERGRALSPADRAAATHRADALLQRLRDRPALGDFTANPLLLSMIATLFLVRGDGKLPDRRVDLYTEICQLLARGRRVGAGTREPLTADELLALLRPFAAYLMKVRRRGLPTYDVLDVMRDALGAGAWQPDRMPELLGYIRDRTGLLKEDERGTWSFAHKTFQEYLAAAHHRTSCVPLPGAIEALLGEDWWDEVLRLYAALGDADRLVAACLEVDSARSLALADDCRREAGSLSPELRGEVELRLRDALQSEIPERRRMAAEARLRRRLRELLPVDAEREIDATFLTCAEYQLFLDDTAGDGEPRVPDHWMAARHLPAQALMPIAGVRAADAQGFCKWLESWQGGGDTFRLPTPAEAAEHAAREPLLATWCVGDETTLSWHPEAWPSIRESLMELGPRATMPASPPTIALDRPWSPALVEGLGVARDLDLARMRRLTRALAVDLDADREAAVLVALRDTLAFAAVLASGSSLSVTAAIRSDDLRALAVALTEAHAIATLHPIGIELSAGVPVASAELEATSPAELRRIADLLDERHRAAMTRLGEVRGRVGGDLAWVRDRARVLEASSRHPEVARKLDQNDVAGAREIAAGLAAAGSSDGAVIEALLEYLLADTLVALRRAARRYLAARSAQEWRSSRMPQHAKELAELHVALVVLLAREDGSLPPWEAIRLVRVRA